MNINMSEIITYVTSDLYLTAYLKTMGYKLKVEKVKTKSNNGQIPLQTPPTPLSPTYEKVTAVKKFHYF